MTGVPDAELLGSHVAGAASLAPAGRGRRRARGRGRLPARPLPAPRAARQRAEVGDAAEFARFVRVERGDGGGVERLSHLARIPHLDLLSFTLYQ